MTDTLNAPTFSHLDDWLEEVGFIPKNDPFKLVAERDTYLEHYFTDFPFFAQIEKPETTFLFLKRGLGKTANRLMLVKGIEKTQKDSNHSKPCLAIEYVDFYRLMHKKDEVTLEDHVDSILSLAVPILYNLSLDPDWNKFPQDLTDAEKKDFVWFIAHYSNLLNPDSIADQIQQIQGLSEEVKKKTAKDAIKLGTDLLGIATGMGPLSNIVYSGLATLLNTNPEEIQDFGKIEPTPLDLMERFANIAQALGFQYIYIFIDKVDELQNIFDYQKVADMLKSLVQTVPLLEMSPYAFKFFLPIEVQGKLVNHLRDDRFNIYSYNSSELWTKKRLREFLKKRLNFYYDSTQITDEAERNNFVRLFEEEVRLRKLDIIDEMIGVAKSSPRNLLKLINMIIDEHTKVPPIDLEISKSTYKQAITKFSANQNT